MVTRQDLKELREGVISYPKGQMREEIASARTLRQECLPTVAVRSLNGRDG